MKRLTTRQASEIRAAARDGSASLRTIARAYGIDVATVHRIKRGSRYAQVPDIEAPRLLQNTPRVYPEDVTLLRKRGMTVPQIARSLGVSERTVYRAAGGR